MGVFFGEPYCAWAPFHERFFHRNSNSMEISFYCHYDSNTAIATKFCTWHDSCAGVACAKKLLRSWGQQRNYSKVKFPSNLNCRQKTVSETGPWGLASCGSMQKIVMKRDYKIFLNDRPWRNLISNELDIIFAYSSHNCLVIVTS